MAEILVRVVTACAPTVLFQLWRRHRKDKAQPAEAMPVGILATAAGVLLVYLVVFIIPVIPAYDWGDILLVCIKLGTVMVGAGLTFGEVRCRPRKSPWLPPGVHSTLSPGADTQR
ncbi:hypothetical protein [Citricoccus alkalitolerans]|uniref:Uncharacterized protein n=1 Tax=Citricoccus alkalitolerans TaxID=246603 RepID=A0ABV8Y282_9MICC